MSELMKYKESPLKMLLTSPTNYGIITSTSTSPLTDQINNISNTQYAITSVTDLNEDSSAKLITYFHQMSADGDKEINSVLLDHSYARPWNWRPETSFIRPTKTLFIPKLKHSEQNSTVPLQTVTEDKDVIDVERISPPPTPIYDVEKAKSLMDECDRFASLARINEDNDDWEETISKESWTPAQNRLFTSMVKILNSDRMARLTYSGSWNEPVLRRTVIDKSVQRTRSLMASISWDTRLTQWLHTLLIDHLSASYLSAYLDILQTLKSKLPTFVEKMMFGPNTINRNGITSNENLFPLLKRTWDPVGISLIQDKPKRLPTNPIIIITPSTLSTTASQSKRLHKWTTLLSTLAHVITVNAQIGAGGARMSMPTCADQLLALTRTKVQEIRNECPNRPLILVGHGAGAAIVCQVAEVEHITAVVCLGFPLLTAEGRRGEADDILLELQSPVLFVIGQNSHKTSCEDMEDLRERMRVETGLVVVGCADDYLRVSKSKRRTEGITQSIVDRCILDEIGDFVGSILLSPYPPVVRSTSTGYTAPNDHFNMKHARNRKRNNSNGSSIESEPPSPQPPRTKQVGRPPGSGRKKLLQNLSGAIPSQIINPVNQISSINNDVHGTIEPGSNILSYVKKPESFHASNNPDVLSRAIQSITPMCSSPSTITGSQILTNRPIFSTGSTLSTLLQNGIRPSPSPTTSNLRNALISGSSASSIRVLDSSMSSRLLTSNTRPMTLVTSGTVSRVTNIGNIVVLPDGKKCIRSGGNINIIQNMKPIGISQPGPSVVQAKGQYQITKPQISNTGMAKVMARKQILTKTTKSSDTQNVSTSNLTTADIMDLPIIFADSDSPILNEGIQEDPNSQIILPTKKASANSKLVVINKQVMSTSTSATNVQQTVKRTVSTAGLKPSNQPVKYTKIIMSKRNNEEPKLQSTFTSQRLKINDSYQITSIMPKKYDPPISFENVDLERELKATTVPKPMHSAMMNSNYLKDMPETSPFITTATKKATISVDGKLTNVTLRSPITFSKNVTPGPSRFITDSISEGSSYLLHKNQTKPGENSASSNNKLTE